MNLLDQHTFPPLQSSPVNFKCYHAHAQFIIIKLEKVLQPKDIILTDSVRLSKVSAISVHCCKPGGVAWLKRI